jgi:uncharacterized membrane protein
MIEIVIRLADTGHSEQIRMEQNVSADKLISQVAQVYKVHPNDQLMLLKSGQQLLPHHTLSKVMCEQNTEKTFVELPNNQNLEKLPCVYLYNLKELHKLA